MVERDNKANELVHLLEAALFMAARPLTLHELKKISTKIGLYSLTEIKNALDVVSKEYAQRESWIEVAEVDGKYFMRVAQQHADVVAELAHAAELSKRALRVLAIVTRNNGTTQAKVVRTLGGGAYEGVKELIEKGFLSAKRAGRTKELWLTKKFKSYFGELKL